MRERSFHGRSRLLAGCLTLVLSLTAAIATAAQAQTGTVRVEVVDGKMPVAGATVSAGNQSATTDGAGIATLTLPAGPVAVTATKDGYGPATGQVDVVTGSERAVRLTLNANSTRDSAAGTLASTRTGLRIEDQAVPVELLERRRIEENMLVTPGSIARALNTTAALRVQTTSPEPGLTTVRIQGLRGRYTRLLSDGVPLYWDIPGGFAPVVIAPIDIDRVEIVTGGASALFGANAVGGVVNLLSRRPGTEANREILLSQSTREATDGVLWLATPHTGSWGNTFLVSGHRQSEKDVDDDGWSDLPGYARGVVRHRLLWDSRRGRSASGTWGVTFEKREGGSTFAHQELETKQADGALFGQMPLGRYTLAGAGSLYVQSRTREFSDATERDRRQGATFEIGIRGTAPRQTWFAGISADWFANRTPGPSLAALISSRGGFFLHDDVQVAPWLSLSGSVRADYNKSAGHEALRIDRFFVSPRGSVLVRGGPWSARVSAGRSYFTPTTLTEETEAAGVARLLIEGPIEVETARSVSGDLTYRSSALTVTGTLFHTQIDDPALIDRTSFTLRTASEPVVTKGVQILGTARAAPFSVTGTYSFIRAREFDVRDVALTPRHSGGVAAFVEAAGRGRIGVEVEYTGVLRLDANAYRSRSEPYTLVSVISEVGFGRLRLFVNGDNLTDVRQTDWDPIVRPTGDRDVDGRWTVDAWAPLAGRVINGGIRVSF